MILGMLIHATAKISVLCTYFFNPYCSASVGTHFLTIYPLHYYILLSVT